LLRNEISIVVKIKLTVLRPTMQFPIKIHEILRTFTHNFNFSSIPDHTDQPTNQLNQQTRAKT